MSEDQEQLRRTVRAFLEDVSPPAEVRRLMATAEGHDPSVWHRMHAELALADLGWVELGIVFEEMGRALWCGPFLSTFALAAGALRAAGGSADLLDRVVGGETVATLAVTEDSGRWDQAGVALGATPTRTAPGGWALDGHKSYVLDGLVADLLLVAARTGGTGTRGVSLFAVDGSAPGLARTPLSTLDLTRKLARLDFSGTPARLIGVEGEGWATVEPALALGAVALAAEQVGGAQRCLETAVEYAKTREQFGRPIGSFQAVKHKCADLLRDVESARSTATYAAQVAAGAGDRDELRLAASLAKACCSEAYLRAAGENIQIHGARGFTWEHDAHLYFKRAKSSALLFGDPTYHRGLLADRLGL